MSWWKPERDGRKIIGTRLNELVSKNKFFYCIKCFYKVDKPFQVNLSGLAEVTMVGCLLNCKARITRYIIS